MRLPIGRQAYQERGNSHKEKEGRRALFLKIHPLKWIQPSKNTESNHDTNDTLSSTPPGELFIDNARAHKPIRVTPTPSNKPAMTRQSAGCLLKSVFMKSI